MNYNSAVKAHFFSPTGVGSIDDNGVGSVSVQSGRHALGDVVVVGLTVNERRHVERLCFKACGNPYLIASMSYLCEKFQGMPLHAFSQYDYSDLVDTFAMPKTKVHSALLAVDSIKKAILQWEQKYE